jgi:hypothetical protein
MRLTVQAMTVTKLLVASGLLLGAFASPSAFAAEDAGGARESDAPVRTVALVSFGVAAETIEDPLRITVSSLDTVSLHDTATTRRDVAAAAEIGTVCGATGTECLVALAVLLRVDLLVAASATHGPDGTVVELAAIDAAVGKEVARERATIARGADPVASTRDAVQLLLEPQLHFGSLVVTCDRADALLAIDGVARAERPCPRATITLRAGQHDVVVSASGTTSFNQIVDVQAGSATEVVATLNTKPAVDAARSPGVLRTVAMVVSGVSAAVALVGGGVALAIERSLTAGASDYDDKAGIQSAGVASLALGGIAAVIALASGAVALFAIDPSDPSEPGTSASSEPERAD